MSARPETTAPTPNGYADYGKQFAPFYDAIFPRAAISAAHREWLTSLTDAASVDVIELGAGTGRVAVPLAEHLHDAGRLRSFTAVDISEPMLDVLRQFDERALIQGICADLLQWDAGHHADLVLCVCGTLGMLTAGVDQQRACRRAAKMLRSDGTLVVEVHNPDFVRAMHATSDATFAIPYLGDRRVLVTFSTLHARSWSLEHRWIDGDSCTTTAEDSRLIEIDDLDKWLSAAGLRRTGLFGDLAGGPVNTTSPTIVATYRK